MNLLINQIEEVCEFGKLAPPERHIVEVLLAAINDWPNKIDSLDDYEKEIVNLIGEELVKQNLAECIARIDLSKNSWKAESLSQLLELFNYFEEGISLNEIFKDITEKLKNQI